MRNRSLHLNREHNLRAQKNKMTPLEIPYKRKAVDPLECIRVGWELVKPQYWLFVGMSLIAFFIGSAVFGLAYVRELSYMPPPPPLFNE